jgi:SAM-dependent methyltransferase
MTRSVSANSPAKAASPHRLDVPATTLQRKLSLARKPFLQALYRDWYRRMLRTVPSDIPGRIVELGSGAGFLKEMLPEVMTSDCLYLPHLDLAAQAEALPFASGSLKGIFLIDVFHHIPRPRRFLAEAARCLRSGGVAVMIEPWRTAWSGFIFRNFHHEPFDPDARAWEFASSGPLSGANGALPWIVFERDRAIFEREFPDLHIEAIQLHTPLVYLLSGGFSFPTIVPNFSFRFWRGVEDLMRTWMRSWAMFGLIVIARA